MKKRDFNILKETISPQNVQVMSELITIQEIKFLIGYIGAPKQVVKSKNFSKIFIVHGHDEALKQSVARLIEKQNIEAIILSEKANKGKTIIEKLEENSDVGCAICLFTPDDIGKANKETNYKLRARQNVVLETGYFMGKLGREFIVYLAKEGLELPSDLQGVVYTNRNNWKIDLLKELKEMGYNIDLNKLV